MDGLCNMSLYVIGLYKDGDKNINHFVEEINLEIIITKNLKTQLAYILTIFNMLLK